MVGQINDTAELNGDGRTLLVTGWVQFDIDEQSAIMEVTVSQGAGAGAATAKGQSGETLTGTKAWTAEIRGKRKKFVPGPAHVLVTAKVTLTSGAVEDYPEPGEQPWERFITLVG